MTSMVTFTLMTDTMMLPLVGHIAQTMVSLLMTR